MSGLPVAGRQFHHEESTSPEDALAHLAQTMRVSPSLAEFETAMLQTAVRELVAIEGALWTVHPERGLTRTERYPETGRPADAREELARARQQIVSEGGQTVLFRETAINDGNGAEQEYPLLLQALGRDGDEASGARLIEIVQHSEISADALAGNRLFLKMLAEMHADAEQLFHVRSVPTAEDEWIRAEDFLVRLNRASRLDEVAAVVVNDGSRFLGCERLTLLLGSDKRLKVYSISSVGRVNWHSDMVKLLQEFSTSALQTREPYWSTALPGTVTFDVNEAAAAFLERTGARSVGVLPLFELDRTEAAEPPALIGALVVEGYAGTLLPEARQRAEILAEQIAPAVERALEWESVPARPLVRAWMHVFGRRGQATRRRVLFWSLLVAAVAATFVLVPADFRLPAEATLQPDVRRNLYAPLSGNIISTHLPQDGRVKKGQELLQIRQGTLAEDYEALTGEYAQVKSRMDAIAALKLNPGGSVREARQEIYQLELEEAELVVRKAGLEKQLAVVEASLAESSVVSPFDGEVLTWSADRLLRDRHVEAGDLLLTVADLDGPWTLEVRISEREFAQVKATLTERKELPVTVRLPNRPDVLLTATMTVDDLSTAAEADRAGSIFVPATVDMPKREGVGFRPGLSASVRIDCGTRALGYVWFHGIWEWFQRNVLF